MDHQHTGRGGHAAAEASADDLRGLAVSHRGITLSDLAAPARAGEAGEISFTLTDASGAAVTAVEISHDRPLHLIVVRTDGAHFRHVHPELDDDGTWRIPFAFDAAGTHRVFADVTPSELGEAITLTSTIEVAGEFRPEPRVADVRTSTVAGLAVEVVGALVAGRVSELVFTVTRDGEPVTALEPYLGAYGHLIALRQGDLAYLHVHPLGEPGDGVTEPGPEIVFMAIAPTAGRYLLYLDVQEGGVVRSIPFVVTATGPAGEQATEATGRAAQGAGAHGHAAHGAGARGGGHP
ncbi:heavy-metal-associated domain-containing protein [Agromyces sp. SYSU T00266]|uniref:heavy-metal-associated domain-containing protein n=1 Tax=Agromyces zhanjiangensis TaxID=3158562 RepID=UPI0033986C89